MSWAYAPSRQNRGLMDRTVTREHTDVSYCLSVRTIRQRVMTPIVTNSKNPSAPAVNASGEVMGESNRARLFPVI